jgi:hypothetical protein
MANKRPTIVEILKQLITSELQFPWYTKLHTHLHLLSYFPVSLSSWRTSCDITLQEVQQQWLYSLWAGINKLACRLSSWVVISCRLPVELWEGQPWVQHQARRLSHQGPLWSFSWQLSALPVWNLDVLHNKDGPALVEKDTRSLSLTLELLRLIQPSVTSALKKAASRYDCKSGQMTGGSKKYK